MRTWFLLTFGLLLLVGCRTNADDAMVGPGTTPAPGVSAAAEGPTPPVPTEPPATPIPTATPTPPPSSTPTPVPPTPTATPIPLSELLGPLRVPGDLAWPEAARDATADQQAALDLGTSFLNLLLLRLSGADGASTEVELRWVSEDVRDVLSRVQPAGERTVVTDGRADEHRVQAVSLERPSDQQITVAMCVHLVTTLITATGPDQDREVTSRYNYDVRRTEEGLVFSLFETVVVSSEGLVDCPGIS